MCWSDTTPSSIGRVLVSVRLQQVPGPELQHALRWRWCEGHLPRNFSMLRGCSTHKNITRLPVVMSPDIPLLFARGMTLRYSYQRFWTSLTPIVNERHQGVSIWFRATCGIVPVG